MGSPGPRGPESREVKELRPSSVRHGLAAVQVAIACLVTLRLHEVQPFNQPLQRLEILQAVDILRAYLAASCCHGSHCGNFEFRAQLRPSSRVSLVSLVSLAQISCPTLLAASSSSFSRAVKEPLAVASAFVLPISPVKDPHKREVFVERWPVQPKW